MLKILAVLASIIFYSTPAFASIDRAIDDAIKPVADFAASIIFSQVELMGQDIPLIIIWLMAIGVFTTFYFRFINLKYFKLACHLLAGKYQAKDREGQISNWQALSTSLSATVGLGNIAGVAVAISIGGPGATVWMIVMGLMGMSTKFLECGLGVKYRQIDKEGDVSGGPMYYISQGFKDRGFPFLGRVLAIFFATCCIGGALGGGNMFQSNQSYQMFMRVAGEGSYFADKAWFFGLILAVLVAIVILGGIKSIAQASSRIFPVMAGLYVLAALAILVSNAALVPGAFMNIFSSAFTASSVGGGILGALVAGVQRAVFSNEAGTGSAAITHAAVRSDSHVAQGLIAMLNPFIDTVVICTVTALVINVTGVYEQGAGVEGITLTARAFATLGEWTIYWLAMTVFLFAYSTLIAWYYLGEKAFSYICGNHKVSVTIFKIVYCLFVIIGAAANMTHVVGFTDSLFFAMAIPNAVTLYIMAPEMRKDLIAYIQRLKIS